MLYDVYTVAKKEQNVILSESGVRVTRNKIQMYVKADQQKKVISITWNFREV